jgi:tetratricopeptide (TPR) repeat protein
MACIRLAALDRGNGRYQTARAYADQALAAAQTAGNQDAAASSCEHIGLCWLDDGDAATAAIWFERGLTLYGLAGGNPRGEAIMRRHLARARITLTGYPAAADHLQAALGTFTALGDAYGQAATLADIAGLHLATGSPAQAVTAMEQALPLAEQATSPFLHARTLTILADALSQAGDTRQARDRLTQASQLHDQLRLPASHQARARARTLAARLDQQENP